MPFLTRRWAVRGDCTWEQHEAHTANHPSEDLCGRHILVSRVRFWTQRAAQECADRRNLKYGGQPSQPVWRPILAVNAYERRWMNG